MKNRGFALTVWFGMTLSALGCGDATGVDEVEVLESTRQAVEPEHAMEWAPGEAQLAGVPMDLATFQYLAYWDYQQVRCVGGITYAECQGELAYALSVNLITQETYNWGMANDFYPVIDRHNTIMGVCKSVPPR